MIGCERCPWYIDGICTEPLDYVNRDTGEDMCSKNPDAIPREEWDHYHESCCEYRR